MHPRVSGGLGGPRHPPNFKRLLHTVHVLVNILFHIMDFGMSAEIRSCGFILPLRKNMITRSFTMNILAHLSRRLIGELIVYPCSGVRPSVRRRSQFQRSSSLKQLGLLFSYYAYTIYR